METKTSSLFDQLKDQKQVTLPQILLVTFVIAASVTAFVFAFNLRMNSDVAPTDSEASALFKYKKCKWDIQCGKGEKCLNNVCTPKNPISDPVTPKCKTNQDCYPNANTCENNKCKILEYPSDGQQLLMGGGYMFKQHLVGAIYYQYTFSQNGAIILTTNELNNGEYAIWPNDSIYKQIKSGKLDVVIKGWNKTRKEAQIKKLTVTITNKSNPTPIVTKFPTPTVTTTKIPVPTTTKFPTPVITSTKIPVPTSTRIPVPTVTKSTQPIYNY